MDRYPIMSRDEIVSEIERISEAVQRTCTLLYMPPDPRRVLTCSWKNHVIGLDVRLPEALIDFQVVETKPNRLLLHPEPPVYNPRGPMIGYGRLRHAFQQSQCPVLWFYSPRESGYLPFMEIPEYAAVFTLPVSDAEIGAMRLPQVERNQQSRAA